MATIADALQALSRRIDDLSTQVSDLSCEMKTRAATPADAVDELNRRVVSQQLRIDALVRAIAVLKATIGGLPSAGGDPRSTAEGLDSVVDPVAAVAPDAEFRAVLDAA